MKTDIIEINKTGKGCAEAIESVKDIALSLNFDEKLKRRLSLLTEETLELFKNLKGDRHADFHIETNSTSLEIKLKIKTENDSEKQQEIPDLSDETKTLSERIEDVIDSGFQNIENNEEAFAKIGVLKLQDWVRLFRIFHSENVYVWSIHTFTLYTFQKRNLEEVDDPDWFSVSHSIIASLSDDVRIYIFKDRVELSVLKKLKEPKEKESYAISPEFDMLKLIPIVDTIFEVNLVKLMFGMLMTLERSSDGLIVEHVEFPFPDSPGGKIDAVIYTPEGLHDNKSLPAVLLLHGGGFALPAIPYHYRMARAVASRVHCRVIMPDYSLTPNYVPPLQMEEAYFVYSQLIESPERYGIDKNRVAVMGDSAGGTLSAAVSLMARDRGITIPAAQVLMYPALDTRLKTESMKKYVDVPIVNARSVKAFYKMCKDKQYKGNKSYRSPMEAETLKGLPPAYIETAEFDSLHDEGINYANRLLEEGCEVVLNETKGTVHAFDMAENSSILKEAMDRRIDYLKSVL